MDVRGNKLCMLDLTEECSIPYDVCTCICYQYAVTASTRTSFLYLCVTNNITYRNYFVFYYIKYRNTRIDNQLLNTRNKLTPLYISMAILTLTNSFNIKIKLRICKDTEFSRCLNTEIRNDKAYQSTLSPWRGS